MFSLIKLIMRYILCIILLSTLCNACFCQLDIDAFSIDDNMSTIQQNHISQKNNLIRCNSVYKAKKNTSYKVVLHLMTNKKIKGTALEFYNTTVLMG